MPRNQILDTFDPQSSVFACWRARFAPAQFLYRLLWFFSLILLTVSGAVSVELRRAPCISKGPALPFAIADFDGDLRPDLASIQIGRSDSNRADYWIQLQLTAVGRQSIRVVAPVGGLQILARDVNGDHAIDLIVTTAGLGEPVAVFLNDGHGGFSQVDQNAYPGSFSDSVADFASAANQRSNAAGMPTQSRATISSEAGTLPHVRSTAGFAVLSNSGFPLDPSLICHLGRAPPPGVPRL